MHKCENSLQRLRKAAGLTLQQLSEKTGVPPSTINNFENGLRGIGDDALEKICRVLKVEVEEVLQVPPEASWKNAVREARAAYPSMSLTDQISQIATTLGVDEARVRDAIADMLKKEV